MFKVGDVVRIRWFDETLDKFRFFITDIPFHNRVLVRRLPDGESPELYINLRNELSGDSTVFLLDSSFYTVVLDEKYLFTKAMDNVINNE